MSRSETGGPGDPGRRRSRELAGQAGKQPGRLEGRVHIPQGVRAVRPGERMQLAGVREAATDRTAEVRELDIMGQLDAFLTHTEETSSPVDVTRTWVRDGDIGVYVRRNRRPFGKPDEGGSWALEEK